MSDKVIQFFLKCQNVKTGEVMTYRFTHQEALLAFGQALAKNQLAVVDTHIAFYDIDLLFNPFDGETLPINAAEINTALDGILR